MIEKTLSSWCFRSFIRKNLFHMGRTMATILDGKILAAELNNELKEEIAKWTENHRKPNLTCVLVGDDPASKTYVKNKIIASNHVGINGVTINLNGTITESELMDKINELNNDDSVDGILVQLPVPQQIDERTICNAISPTKDVDGFHIENIGKMTLDMKSIVPCTAIGVIEILKRYKIPTFGKNAVVIGRSKNVSLPIAMLLHSDGNHEAKAGLDATVTICHRYTPSDELKFYCQHADIIVSATGVPKLVKADMVKPGAAVIDVGMTRISCPDTGKTKYVGDVDFEEVSKIAGAITPVPGGVGPLTVAMLMRNTFEIAKNRVNNINL